MLGAPHRGVGGIDSDHTDTGLGAHAEQAGAELAGGDAGDQLPELFLPAVLLPRPGVGEVEVLDRDGLHAGRPGPLQEAGEGVAERGVAVGGGAGQVVVEAARAADGVAVLVQRPGGKVAGVGVHADDA